MNIRHGLAWAALLILASSAFAQDQNYNEDWIAPAEVPPAVRASAEKAVPGVRFEAAYRGRDLGYRFVGAGPDKKTVSVKVAEDGRLISTRTWTPTTLARVPRAAMTALQTEVQDNPQITGFRASKATSVELFRADKGKTEAFFELFGARGDQTPARAEVTAEGVVRRAEIILKHPIERDRTQAIATASIPPPARQKVLEASPGSTFARGIYRIENGGRTVITAIGLDKSGRPVEVMVEIIDEPKAEVRYSTLSVSTQVPPGEVPEESQAKLREGIARDKDLKGFRTTETRRVFLPWNSSANTYYLLSGKNAEGKPMQVKIGHNSSVESWEDRKAAAEEATLFASRPASDRKFAVLSARFGLHDRWVDVTDLVRAEVKEHRLDKRPANLPDAAYGSHKVLVVAYSADGRVGLEIARDDGPITLPPSDDGAKTRSEVPAKGLAILSARYGVDDRVIDVTDALRGRIADGKLELANPSVDLPDPAVGVHKTLAVAYSIDGEVGIRLCRDDRPFTLPEGRPITGAPAELWKAELPGPPTAGSVGFSGDGKLIFLGGEDGVVRYLDAANGKGLGRLEDTGEGRVDTLAVSPSGAILVARPGRPVRLWPSKISKQPIPLGDYKEAISALAISPKGDQAATGSWDKTARLWDLKTGKQIRQFLGNKAVVMGVGFALEGRQLITTSWDGTARTWDASTAGQKLQYEGDNGQLGKAYVSKDGKIALFVSDRGSLITWDPATGKVITRVVAPACTGWALALSPDARWMADAEENVAVLREVATLKVAARLERHFAQVKVLAFSPDSRTLLTSGDDKVARLWKLPEPGR